MSTQHIASRLSRLCNKGDFERAQKELFVDDAVSIEMHDWPASFRLGQLVATT